MRIYRYVLCLFLSAAMLAAAQDGANDRLFQKKKYKPWRSINTDQYELAILKNGKAAWQLRTGQTFFREARPQVTFAGKDAKNLDGSGKSTVRQEVVSPLGAGQGLSHMQPDCEWILSAYPTKPYVTMQIVYINNTKKPVRIASLSPWHVEEGTRGAIFPDLRPQDLLQYPPANRFGQTGTLEAGEEPLTLINPANAKSFIAGFITQENGKGHVSMEWNEDGFIRFDARCVYDPPIEILPGGRLESELLYLASSFETPIAEISRFGKATALINTKNVLGEVLPHGWVVELPTDPAAFSMEQFDAELTQLQELLAPFGWDHVVLSPQQRPGPFETAESYDFKALSDAIHSRGLTVGLKVNAFSYFDSPSVDAAIQSRACNTDALRVLDSTDEASAAVIRDAGQRWVTSWGMDALYVQDSEALRQVQLDSEDSITRTTFFQWGVRALRKGAGGDPFISVEAPQAWTGANIDGISLDKLPQKTMEQHLSRKFYLHPLMYHPVLEVNPAQEDSLAFHLGLGSLSGGVLHFTTPPSQLSQAALTLMQQSIPTAYTTMLPLDAHEHQPPQLWGLPLGTEAQPEGLVAAVNWTTTQQQKYTIPFPALKLSNQKYYTVYDPNKENYYGLARQQLNLECAPKSIRFIDLKPFNKHPLLLETASPYYLDGSRPSTQWDSTGTALHIRGKYRPRGREAGTLSFLVPKSFEITSVTIDGKAGHFSQEEQLAQIAIRTPGDTPINWEVHFRMVSTP